jgi:DNA-binding CsgD family transcriptional regulator
MSERARRPRAGVDMWEVTADLIFLIKNPVLRSACFPVGAGEHVVEPATPGDAAAIARIAGAHEGPEARDLLLRWRDRHPEAFAVARAPDGTPAALLHVAEIGAVDPLLLRADPVARAWVEHLLRVPPRPGDRVLVMRRWLGAETGEMLAPEVGACWLDVKRVYIELRPRLSRLYSAMADPVALAPIFEPLGFAPVGEPVAIGQARYQPVWLDFGEGSVDGWLSRLVDAEIDAAEAEAPPDGDGLTAREREVLALIADGLSNRRIGERLFISDKTAGRHVSNIFAKLGVHTRAEAARIAAERRIAGAPPGA